jgi:hypothetical protein
MRARAGLIDAQITWGPREGGGTVFTLNRKAAHSEASGALSR